MDFLSNNERPKWASELVRSFERMYNSQISLHDKINYLITCFIEYRNQHSMGEYDYTIVLDTEIENERSEISDFLIEKFEEVQKELSILSGNNFSKIVIEQYEKKKSNLLRAKLEQYGFYNLPMVLSLDEAGQARLVDLICESSIPYNLALFDYLGFIKYLQSEYFGTKSKMYVELAIWFHSDKSGRAIKGNLSTLSSKSTENREKYTAHLHKETVIFDYEKLK